MKFSSKLQDGLIRMVFISAGVVSAVLFTLHGQGDVLPPLALGGLLGACLVGGLGNSSEN
jgi:hypothetical protein